MKISAGTQIRYTSAAGTRHCTVRSIDVAPTAKPGFMNTWLLLDIPAQGRSKFPTTVAIPADNASLRAFQVEVI